MLRPQLGRVRPGGEGRGQAQLAERSSGRDDRALVAHQGNARGIAMERPAETRGDLAGRPRQRRTGRGGVRHGRRQCLPVSAQRRRQERDRDDLPCSSHGSPERKGNLTRRTVSQTPPQRQGGARTRRIHNTPIRGWSFGESAINPDGTREGRIQTRWRRPHISETIVSHC